MALSSAVFHMGEALQRGNEQALASAIANSAATTQLLALGIVRLVRTLGTGWGATANRGALISSDAAIEVTLSVTGTVFTLALSAV